MLCLISKVQGPVHRKGHKGHGASEHGIPIKNSGVCSCSPVRPQGQIEVAVRTNWNSTNYICQRNSEEDRQERACKEKYAVPEAPPECVVNVATELYRQPTKNQQPEHDHQRHIEPTERGGVEQWKCKEQRATCRN